MATSVSDPEIFFYDHCARMSGAEISMLNTISALPSKVTVVLGEDGPLVSHLIGAGAEVVPLPLPVETAMFSRNRVAFSAGAVRQVIQVVRYARRLSRELERRSATVVVSNSMKGHVIVSVARLFGRFRVVFYLHDRVVPEFMSPTGVRLQRLLIRIVPHALIANSRSTMETAPMSPRHRARVIAGGPIAPPGDVEPASAYGRPFTFGMIGRISPWKGQDVALRAFAAAFPSGDERLELAGAPLFGEQQHLADLQSLASQLKVLDRVQFLGHVDDVYALMRGWDVALHASTIPEPFGLVVAQAMAVGLPVIASDEGGPAEMIENGRTGLLVKPRDPQLLADAMIRIAADGALRTTLGANARSSVAQYLPDVVAGRLLTTVRAATRRRVDADA